MIVRQEGGIFISLGFVISDASGSVMDADGDAPSDIQAPIVPMKISGLILCWFLVSDVSDEGRTSPKSYLLVVTRRIFKKMLTYIKSCNLLNNNTQPRFFLELKRICKRHQNDNDEAQNLTR